MFQHLPKDLPAGMVVFLVALPLCLGIALASGAPPLSGLISGIIGGLVVALLSGSQLSVSGPAAGLAVIVADAIHELGSFPIFLVAVVIAGLMQLIMGILKWGKVADFIPNSVIKGMLAAIGIVIFLKQIPHALGRDADWEGDMYFFQFMDGENTFSEIYRALMSMSLGAVIITGASLLLLILWQQPVIQRLPLLKLIPGPLLVVILGILLNQAFAQFAPALYLRAEDGHLVNIPLIIGDGMGSLLTFPDWSGLFSGKAGSIMITALTVAIIASLETLLSIEASDKLDPEKHISDTDRELRAQGIGNLLSGLVGGLPITSVIVRTSANIYSGAKTRMSAFVHGLLLLATVLLIPTLLNLIPLACLAAILLQIGYKLASPKLFRSMFAQGHHQFHPFIATVLAIVFTDLLIGIVIGIVVGLVYVIKSNFHSPIELEVNQDGSIQIHFRKDISFLNKARLKECLRKIPEGSHVIIDGSGATFIDQDIYDILEDYEAVAGELHRITVEHRNMKSLRLKLLDSKTSHP